MRIWASKVARRGAIRYTYTQFLYEDVKKIKSNEEEDMGE
jgi:hypothetical protein